MICKTYPLSELGQYRYVVILSVYNGKILLSRHKERTTWETQGGHIEPGETPMEAAKRELYEESGAVSYTIQPLCDYWAGEPETGAGANGMVFTAQIEELQGLPDSEMAEVQAFGMIPQNLTYPDITPVLFARIGHYFYKKAGLADLDVLVKTRIKVLRAANKLPEDAGMPEAEAESARYYQRAFQDDLCAAYLVYDADKVIGAGGISFYQVMPTYHNASGKKAYIMNMYTDPAYRRRGIAYKMLDVLMKEAADRGILQVTLEATQAGKPLYLKYGFVPMQDEMEWKSM